MQDKVVGLRCWLGRWPGRMSALPWRIVWVALRVLWSRRTAPPSRCRAPKTNASPHAPPPTSPPGSKGVIAFQQGLPIDEAHTALRDRAAHDGVSLTAAAEGVVNRAAKTADA